MLAALVISYGYSNSHSEQWKVMSVASCDYAYQCFVWNSQLPMRTFLHLFNWEQCAPTVTCYDSLSQAYSECSKRTKHHAMDLITSRSTFSNLLYPANLFHGNIQGVQGGKVNIMGGYSIGHAKQKKCICTCVLFRTASEIELFHYTV
jgi:hypothetical protein